jgi:hypothetical protein
MNFRRVLFSLTRTAGVIGAAALLSQCSTSKVNRNANVVVSVKEQKLALYTKDGKRVKEYPVSTSKFGLNDKPGNYGTPLGMHEIVAKIGQGVPPGSVFKSRQLTGEVLKPDAPGRDPIVTRIMWLRGMESQNKNAYGRCIYIHGTAEERNIGKPVSYGCIRMKSRDVMDVFDRTGIGSNVLVVEGKLPGHVPAAMPAPMPATPENAPPIFLSPNPNAHGPLGKPEQPEAMMTQNTPATAPAPAPATAPSQRGRSYPNPGTCSRALACRRDFLIVSITCPPLCSGRSRRFGRGNPHPRHRVQRWQFRIPSTPERRHRHLLRGQRLSRHAGGAQVQAHRHPEEGRQHQSLIGSDFQQSLGTLAVARRLTAN